MDLRSEFKLFSGERQINDANILDLAWGGCSEHNTNGVNEIMQKIARDIMQGSLLENALCVGESGITDREANVQANTFIAAAREHKDINWAISQSSTKKPGEPELRLWVPNHNASGGAQKNIVVSILFANIVSSTNATTERHTSNTGTRNQDNLVAFRENCDAAIATVNHAIHSHTAPDTDQSPAGCSANVSAVNKPNDINTNTSPQRPRVSYDEHPTKPRQPRRNSADSLPRSTEPLKAELAQLRQSQDPNNNDRIRELEKLLHSYEKVFLMLNDADRKTRESVEDSLAFDRQYATQLLDLQKAKPLSSEDNDNITLRLNLALGNH